MIKNKKGFTLIEVVVAITILGIISMVVYNLFEYSMASFFTGSKYSVQQDKLVEVVQKIRVYVEEAKSVKYDSAGKVLILSNYNLSDSDLIDDSSKAVQCWKFEGESLKVRSQGQSEYKNIVDGLDVSKSSFSIDASGRLIVKVKPNELNGNLKNRNVTEPLVSEISVRYKN